MRQDLRVWNQAAFADAIAVNCNGTFDALEVVKDTFPQGFREIYFNSTWGDQSGEPLLYQVVEASKGLAKNRFQVEAPLLAKEGIPISIVIASLVNDTNVGKMFNDFFLNLMDKDQREAVRSSSVWTKDVWAAVRTLLASNPTEWPSYPYNLYVYRKSGMAVVERALELSAMYTQPYRF